MKLTVTACIVAAMNILLAPHASAITVDPGQELIIDFHLPYSASPMLTLHPTDTAYLSFDIGTPSMARSSTAKLYSGGLLLGANTTEYSEHAAKNFYFFWTATGSYFTIPSATKVDGSTLRDRSIVGQIRTTFDASVAIDTLYLDAGDGWGNSIGIEGGTQAVVDSVRVAAVSSVPEPGNALMLLGGLLALGWCTSRRAAPAQQV